MLAITDLRVKYIRTLIPRELRVLYLHDENHEHLPNTLEYGKVLDVGMSHVINMVFHVIEAEATDEMEVEDSVRCILVVRCRKTCTVPRKLLEVTVTLSTTASIFH